MHGSLDFMELLRLLLKKLWLIMLFSFVGFLCAFGVTKLVLKPMYTSSIRMYVNSSSELSGGSKNYYDVITAQKLTNTYAEIIRSDRLLDEVRATENIQYTANQLRRMMSVITVNETEIMKVTVNAESPQMAMDIANAIAEISPETIRQITKTGSVEILDNAKFNPNPSSPNLSINCIVGILLGLSLSVLYIVLKDLLDLHIKGEEDIKKHYSIPVLGSIPVLNSQTKGGTQYYER